MASVVTPGKTCPRTLRGRTRSTSTAVVDSGTVRASPFLVSGKWAVRRFMSMCSQRRRISSPWRMAVSSASCTMGSSQGLRAAWQASSRRASSPACRRRCRGLLSDGSLISRTGLWTWMPHSLRATSNTWPRSTRSRLTVDDETFCSRSSRKRAISTPRTPATNRRARGCRMKARRRFVSGAAPFFNGVTSTK